MTGRALATILAVAVLAPCGRREYRETAAAGSPCTVGRIIDGDTFACADGRRVRLIGIDTPERGQRPFGARARRQLERLVPVGATVQLEGDITPTDRYGRTLAYVWTGDTLVNEAMVLGGWAVLLTIPPNVKYADRFQRAQKQAREARAGLWSEGGFECLPGDYRKKRCGPTRPSPAAPSRARDGASRPSHHIPPTRVNYARAGPGAGR